ncbi:TlpA family protein disulfide reductase [uncultured Sphingomonas sp.]|uniref:TlpA family protein disulfide reductase n=1 Tax=uncultured Sphingomonas sp. TaxID=158754 RepID=UPI0035CCA915
MLFSLILAAAAIAGSPAAEARPVTEAGAPLAGPAIVVLWASWCASCKAEVQRLPRLAAAAAPLPIRTLAIDPADVARKLLIERSMPLEGAYADARPPRAVLDGWGGAGSALPIAVALDAKGQVCGRKLGLLGTDQLRDWAARCR